MSVGTGTNLGATLSTLVSSNTNNVTGAGTFNESGNRYTPSFGNNATTQTYAYTKGSGISTAPSAGAIGERIESTATAVAMGSNSPKTVTSINLTPGVWDVSALAFTLPTGGTAIGSVFSVSISTTNNTIVGNLGIETFDFASSAFNACSGCVPSYRILLAATTTYFLVCNVIYTSTSSPTNGRLSATRVA